MNVVIVWARMFSEWDTLEDERHYGFGQRCFGNRMLSNMNTLFLREGARNTAFYRLGWLSLKRT